MVKDYSADIKKIKEFIIVMGIMGHLDADGEKYAQNCLEALDEIEKALKDQHLLIFFIYS